MTGWRGAVAGPLAAALGLLAAPAPTRAESPVEQQRHVEGALLHRRLDLTGLERLVRGKGRWEPFAAPTGQTLVINLWQLSCKPCLDEMPVFRQMAQAWRKDGRVRFLFVSSPPEQSVPVEIAAYWRQHQAALPDEDPLRARDDRLAQELDTGLVPLTLLLDPDGVIRQVFAGSISERRVQLGGAIDRLLKVVAPR